MPPDQDASAPAAPSEHPPKSKRGVGSDGLCRRLPCDSPCPRTSTRSGSCHGSGDVPARVRPLRGRVPARRSRRSRRCTTAPKVLARVRVDPLPVARIGRAARAAVPCPPPSRSSSRAGPRRPLPRTNRCRRRRAGSWCRRGSSGPSSACSALDRVDAEVGEQRPVQVFSTGDRVRRVPGEHLGL